MMSETIQKHCKNCHKVFYPRKADVVRGWGKFCNKSCKAQEQEKRTHQFSQLLNTPTSQDMGYMALADAKSKF